MSTTPQVRTRHPLVLVAIALFTIVSITGAGLVQGQSAQAADISASRSAAATPPQADQSVSALRTALLLWWSAARGDNFIAGTAAEDQSAREAGYSFSRQEGWGLKTQDPGTVPLYLFWSAGRGDNFSTATQVGIDSAYAAGYSYAGIQAYIYPVQVSGTVPLYQFWSSTRQDNFATATAEGINSAYAAGYTLARVEGYVYPN
ncbi:hypothetical protein [Streptomyces sp. NPDC057617]|uniref:hypothetical protein n=1 Tax=Streptomyces sp. NPDC057617 TaxID=3346184 RepID=UPI0036C87B9D